MKPEGEALAVARIDLAIATELARAAAIADIAMGMSESEAAREYGVTRMTIRAWRSGSAD
jgi:predicted transcriptional regulator